MKFLTQFAFIVLLLIIITCKKESETLQLSGSISDPGQNKYIENAEIILMANGINSGVYSSGFSEIARTKSNSEGFFTFEFKKQNCDTYRLITYKDNFFTKTTDISASVFTSANSINQDVEFHSSGFISLHLRNTFPIDEQDKIIFNFTGTTENCSDCCTNISHTGSGTTFDTTITCRFYGNMPIYLFRSVFKNNQTTVYNDSLYCPAFNTAYYTYDY